MALSLEDGIALKLFNKVTTSALIDSIWRHFSSVQDIRVQMQKNAVQEAAKYVEEHLLAAVSVNTPQAMLEFACSQVELDGLVMEFGVADGNTIALIAKRFDQIVHGFDSCQGLPEFWTDCRIGQYDARFGKGHFDRGGKPPVVPKNVQLHVGWFDQTLPQFVEAYPGNVAFLHVDCDLYSSTQTIFKLLGDRIRPGTVIAFNEYFNYPGWKQHEYKAFQEFVTERNLKYEYLGYNNRGFEVVVKILPS